MTTVPEDVGEYDEILANTKVDGSTDYENGENLPEGWNVALKFSSNAARTRTSRWLDKSQCISNSRILKKKVKMSSML